MKSIVQKQSNLRRMKYGALRINVFVSTFIGAFIVYKCIINMIQNRIFIIKSRF